MKTLYKIGMLAVAAIALVGCSKETETDVPEKTNGTHVLTFTAQKDVDTRTAVSEGDTEASFVWTAGDEAYFHIYENETPAQSVSMSLNEDKTIATFTATFENKEADSFVYKAVYGKSVSGSNNPLIPYEQSPKLNSFDPSADVLVSSEDIILDNNAKAGANTKFLFKLRRVVSVNKMTIKGLQSGERISSVEIESSDKYFAARYMWSSGTYSNAEGSKKLVLDYSQLNAVPDSDGNFPVYFTAAPVDEASFLVKVITDQYVYTRPLNSKLTLDLENFLRFGINVSGYGILIPTPTEYKLVEDNAKIAARAKYLIVAQDYSKAAGAYNTGKYYEAVDVTISNKVVAITSQNVQTFTLEAAENGQFYIKDADNKYLRWGSGNSVEQSDTKYSWTVTKDGITSATTTDRKLKYNSGSPRFACYTSGQAAISLFVDESTILADPELSFSGEATITLNLGDTFNAPTLNNPHGVSVTYSSSNPDIAAVDASGTVTIGSSAGQTTITASFAGNSSYFDSEVSYEIIVIDPDAERWVKTAIGEITLSDVFVIVGGGYAVSNNNGTGSAPVATAVTFVGEALSDIPAANLKWKLTGSASNGYSFSPANDATKFLYCSTTATSGSNDNIRVGTGDRKVWEFDSNGIMKTKDDKTVRYFSKYNNQDWRGYTNTSNGAIALEFYVKQGGSSTPSATLSSISVTAPNKTTYNVGDTFDATGMVVTATYSDATTADVTASATTDFATQVASAGNKTVTVSYTEDDVTVTGTFNITVTQPSGITVSFEPSSDFSGQGTANTGSAISATKDGITFSCDKGYGTTQIRCYSGSKITISAESGKTIKSISFTFSGSSYTGGLEASYSLNSGSWEKTLSSQARLMVVSVTYE